MNARTYADLVRLAGKRNVPKDSILAHITPEEARLLKRRGGSGEIDPDTGLPHFESDEEGGSSASVESPGGDGDSGQGPDDGGNGNSWQDPSVQWNSPQEGVDPVTGRTDEEQFTYETNLGGFQNDLGGMTRGDLTASGMDWGADRGWLDAFQDARGWQQGLQQWSRDNPWTSAAIQYGAPVIGNLALGPIGGAVVSGLSNLARGEMPSAAPLAGALGGPTAALGASVVESAAKGNLNDALGTAINAGANYGGIGWGQFAQDQFGSKGPMTAALANMAGNLAQNYAVSQGLNALGIQNNMDFGSALGGYGVSGPQDTSSESNYSMASFSAPMESASFAPASFTAGAYAPQAFGGGGGMDIGSSYVQKIKDLYAKQTGAFEPTKRKTWYAEQSPWEIVK